jgi:hypothetical protein
MRQELTIAPCDWLGSGTISIADIGSVLAAFTPGTSKVVRFIGPHRFFRAAGWDAAGKQASAYGSWWADESVLAEIGTRVAMFEGWLPGSILDKALPVQYRGAVALCENWNDMREIVKLELPDGEVITGIAGLTAPQPQDSRMNPALKKTPMLSGGAEQIFFKKTRALNSINPLWVYTAQHL